MVCFHPWNIKFVELGSSCLKFRGKTNKHGMKPPDLEAAFSSKSHTFPHNTKPPLTSPTKMKLRMRHTKPLNFSPRFHQHFLFRFCVLKKTTSWWLQLFQLLFNPSEKYARGNGKLPQFSGWKSTIFELPPPRKTRSFQRKTFFKCSINSSTFGRRLSICFFDLHDPYHPWDWYIYLHLVTCLW